MAAADGGLGATTLPVKPPPMKPPPMEEAPEIEFVGGTTFKMNPNAATFTPASLKPLVSAN